MHHYFNMLVVPQLHVLYYILDSCTRAIWYKFWYFTLSSFYYNVEIDIHIILRKFAQIRNSICFYTELQRRFAIWVGNGSFHHLIWILICKSRFFKMNYELCCMKLYHFSIIFRRMHIIIDEIILFKCHWIIFVFLINFTPSNNSYSVHKTIHLRIWYRTLTKNALSQKNDCKL